MSKTDTDSFVKRDLPRIGLVGIAILILAGLISIRSTQTQATEVALEAATMTAEVASTSFLVTRTPNSPTPEAEEQEGRVAIEYPQRFVLHESGIVTLQIDELTKLASSIPPDLTGNEIFETALSIKVSGEREATVESISIFPAMSAELHAPAFKTLPGNDPIPNVLNASFPTIWAWTVIAEQTGKAQVITINIYWEDPDGVEARRLIKTIAREVFVAPRPIGERLLNSALLSIFSTSGVIGLLFALYDRARKHRKLEDTVAVLDNKVSELIAQSGADQPNSGDPPDTG